MNLSEQTIIVGLGRSGYATAQYLAAKNQPFMLMDSRAHPKLLKQFRADFADIKIHLGGLDETLLTQAKMIILAPGLAKSLPAIQAAIAAKVEVIGDIELFIREAKKQACQLVLITGSNGKTTVTTLLEQVAQQAGINAYAGGNIGRPALDLLKEQADLYVLELSSFQLETTPSLYSDAATVLNISPDHLDRYASVAEYAQAKQFIYQNAKNCIVNCDDQQTLNNAQNNIIGFSLHQPKENDFGLADGYLKQGDKNLIAIKDIKMLGQHNVANALAVLALANALNIPLEAVIETLKSFSGLVHRTEFVREVQGVQWVNDSKATNIGACKAAIEGLANKKQANIILLAGGQGKGADFNDLVQPISEHVHHVILFGEDAKKISQILTDQCGLIQAISLEDAVNQAAEIAESGDLVLLSPACASFDLFDGFEHRGDCFKESVWRLPA